MKQTARQCVHYNDESYVAKHPKYNTSKSAGVERRSKGSAKSRKKQTNDFLWLLKINNIGAQLAR